MNTSRQR